MDFSVEFPQTISWKIDLNIKFIFIKVLFLLNFIALI